MLNNDMVQGGHIRIHLIILQQDVRVAWMGPTEHKREGKCLLFCLQRNVNTDQRVLRGTLTRKAVQLKSRSALTELEAETDDGQRGHAHHHQEEEAVASQHRVTWLVRVPFCQPSRPGPNPVRVEEKQVFDKSWVCNHTAHNSIIIMPIVIRIAQGLISNSGTLTASR